MCKPFWSDHHVPRVRSSLKPIRLQKRPKTEMLFEKETQKKTQHKQRKISCLNTCCPHVFSWVLLYTNSILWLLVAEQSILLVVFRRLFVGGDICHTYVIFHGFSWPKLLRWLPKWYSLKFNTILTKQADLFYRAGLPLHCSCIVTHFLEMIVCLWWWDPAQHYPLHLAIVHYCTQCGTVSEAISW